MNCYPGLRKELEPQGVSHYFTFGNVPAPLTIYKDVYKLGPGEYLTHHNGTTTLRRYWEPRFHGTNDLSEGEIKERLYYELAKAVELRLVSDVPLGAFLSGGIDSSIIVALMARHSAKPVKTFSIGFKDADLFDETRYAREVAELNHTDHHEFKLTYADMVNVLDFYTFRKVISGVFQKNKYFLSFV